MMGRLRQRPIYIAGRYRKYSRTVAQTPWYVDEGRMGDLSVEERIVKPFVVCASAQCVIRAPDPLCSNATAAQTILKASECTFHTAGREDIDVRMLGKGRPFAVELADVKLAPSSELLAVIEHTLNHATEENATGDVEVSIWHTVAQLRAA